MIDQWICVSTKLSLFSNEYLPLSLCNLQKERREKEEKPKHTEETINGHSNRYNTEEKKGFVVL
jgi:hypothetical protein